MTTRTGPRRRILWSVALWAVLLPVLAGAGWAGLSACGLAFVDGRPVLTFCPDPPEPSPLLAVLAEERAQQARLEADLHRLRLTMLASADCALPPEPEPEPIEVAEVIPEPEPEPPVEEPEPPVEEPEVVEEPEPEPIEVAQVDPPGLPARRPTPPPLPPPPATPPQPVQPAPAPDPPIQQAAAPPPPPPGPVFRCNTDLSAAGQHDDRRTVNLGTEGGIVTVNYDTLRVPDRIEVWYRGRPIVTTPGMVSGRGQLQFFFLPEANDPYVQVVVISNRLFPTRWGYRVNCPY